MADISIGDIRATLRLDTSQLQQGMREAQQALGQLQQSARAATQSQGQMAQGFQQTQQAVQATTQAVGANTQAVLAGIQAQRQTTQAVQHVTQAVEAMHSAMTAATQATAASSTAFSAWRGALQVASGIGLATTIQGIVGALKDFITSSVQAAARMEQLRAQFTALQGAGQGAVTLQGLFQTAQRLGVEFVSLAQSFRGFDAATRGTALEGERAQRVFEQITTGARAMGATSEQTARALLALQQMVSKGTVSQEELRQQLGEALPGAMGIAARAFGVTTAEMNKMVEKGMDAVQFVQIFGAQVEREFGGKAATATNTLTAAWQRFSNELEQFQGSLAGGDLVNALRDLASWSTKVLENLRAAAELRKERTGGELPAVPREMSEIPALQTRQKAMQDLQEMLKAAERGFTIFDRQKFGPMPTDEELEERRTKLAALVKEQLDQIQRIKAQWDAETTPPATTAQLPGQRQLEAMRKILEDQERQLRAIDMTAAFVTPLELAEQRAKVLEETMKRLREEAGRFGAGLRESLIPTGKQTPFDTLIEEAAARYRQDPNVIRALIEQESGFNPSAVSPKGATGLMQLMPDTAAMLGGAGKDLKDAATNIDLGTKYFAQLMQRFGGDLTKALTAYNAGPGRGGIPLATGENATFARDVLRRMPQTPGDILAGQEARRRVGESAAEAETRDRENEARIRATGREYLRAQEEQERQAEADARERRQQVFATGREQNRARDEDLRQMEQAIETLRHLGGTYEFTKQRRDADTASVAAARLAGTIWEEEAQQLVETIRQLGEAQQQARLDRLDDNLDQILSKLQVARFSPMQQALGELTREFTGLEAKLIENARAWEQMWASADPDERVRIAERLNQITDALSRFETVKAQRQLDVLGGPARATLEDMQHQVEQGEAARQARLGTGLEYRYGAEISTMTEDEARQRSQLLEQLQAQERLNYYMGIFEDLATSVGSAWTNALFSIADGTKTVAAAFKEMARSILQSMAQIASQEAFKALIKIGFGILGAAFGGTAAVGGGTSLDTTGGSGGFIAGMGASSGGQGGVISSLSSGGGLAFRQHGGWVNRPTLTILGERGPELVSTQAQVHQMQAQMRAGGGSGDSGGISIHNYPSRAEAERGAAQDRAAGKQAIVNEVLADLGRGESSLIQQVLRKTAR